MKKLIPIFFLGILFVVTYQVTKKEESSAISAIKEKLQKNIEEENASVQKTSPSKINPPVTSTTFIPPESKPNLLNENPSLVDPAATNPAVTNKADDDKTDTTSQRSLRKQTRIFPKRGKDKTSVGASDKKSSSSSIPSGGPGVVSSGASQRTFVVTENGEGDSYVLQEALRMIRSGDKLQLRKGTYTFLMIHQGVPDVDITGEGEETVLEIPETLKVQQRNLSLNKVRLLNTGTSSVIEVSNGKRVTANEVTLIGNGNDCISLLRGDANLTKVRLERCNRAVFVRESTPQLTQLTVSDSDYGIYFAGNAGFGITGMKAETINLFSIFFTSDSVGSITCTGCRLTENATNRRTRLQNK